MYKLPIPLYTLPSYIYHEKSMRCMKVRANIEHLQGEERDRFMESLILDDWRIEIHEDGVLLVR